MFHRSVNILFQLTPSRRATLATPPLSRENPKFQLTPSRRATFSWIMYSVTENISTHALTEGDESGRNNNGNGEAFQLTPSRRATRDRGGAGVLREISTHALTEGDRMRLSFRNKRLYFNSRPHGGRPAVPAPYDLTLLFQLTPSRRATANLDKFFF